MISETLLRLRDLRSVHTKSVMTGLEYDPEPNVQSTLGCSTIPTGRVALRRRREHAHQASDPNLALVETRGKRWLVSRTQLEKATGLRW